MKVLAVLVVLCAAWSGARAQSLVVDGLVARPGAMGAAALAALKQVSFSGSFDSMSGRQTHRWTGPLLLDVLDRAGMIDEPGKRTHMRHVIIARGSDGYGAAVAIGEIDPKGQGKQAIIALVQDGVALKAPRLVMPGDASFTRAVHDLAELKVK